MQHSTAEGSLKEDRQGKQVKGEFVLMEHTDKNITCKDCEQTFTFTAGEQSFYAEKGFENEPVRCPSCRGMRKRNRNGMGSRGLRQMHDVVCHDCGKPTQVPFEPRESRPVFCRDCYDRINAQAV